MQVKKQQLEPDMGQTGFKCGKEYVKAVYCHPAYLTYMQSSVQLLSRVQLFATLWTAARQASLSITNSQSLLKQMSIESVKPSNHINFCRPLLLQPSIFPSIRVFSNESALRIRFLPYGVICISEVIDISCRNLHSSLSFIQQGTLHDVLCIKLNKQGNNTQP